MNFPEAKQDNSCFNSCLLCGSENTKRAHTVLLASPAHQSQKKHSIISPEYVPRITCKNKQQVLVGGNLLYHTVHWRWKKEFKTSHTPSQVPQHVTQKGSAVSISLSARGWTRALWKSFPKWVILPYDATKLFPSFLFCEKFALYSLYAQQNFSQQQSLRL